ncbi:MAG: bifunctional N-acetylglucosamine-1-phosphate uridyltransferase/glucosamine-1-phosphate acetyltransferase [Planctomycetes bacterium]|nr:bifunctional N-acetylglucosamine-1-phosphate uridyltransferase/glucosamine-1-phosphate acetyltransferase [Planctomycetota bacterium]
MPSRKTRPHAASKPVEPSPGPPGAPGAVGAARPNVAQAGKPVLPSGPRVAAVILAAGKGVRLKSSRAKVLHEVAGRPVLDYVLDAVEQAGITDVYVVIGHEAETVKGRFSTRPVKWIPQPEQRGTADAVRCCEPALGTWPGEMIVLVGDDPLIRPETIQALLAAHRAEKATVTVVTGVVENASGYGRVVRDRKGHVEAIVEERDADAATKKIREINSGIYAFNARACFAHLRRVKPSASNGEYYLTEVVRLALAAKQRVVAYEAPDAAEVLGINTCADLAQAGRIIRQRIMDRHLANGVIVVDPASTYIEDGVIIGPETVILPYSVIHRGASIGSHCEVGPFAHLRNGARLSDHAEIGNFVEVKNTDVGSHTKAKHLTYLGDAVIGRNVNIGAGTITANYDGKRKNRTVIEDEASTGSGTVLVAPVKMGRGSSTGAGAIVTRGHDVAPGDTVVGVPARSMRGKGG